jgi:hypothetical protein
MASLPLGEPQEEDKIAVKEKVAKVHTQQWLLD